MDINKMLEWGNAVTGQTLHELKAQEATQRNRQALREAAQSSRFAQAQAERYAVSDRLQAGINRAQEQGDKWFTPSDVVVNREGLPGVVSNLYNTALGAVDGATHYAGQAIGSLFESDATLQGVMVPDHIKEAHGRYLKGQASAQDLELLNTRTPITPQRLIPRTYKETLDDINAARKIAGGFYGDKKKDVDGYLDTDFYNEYHRDARNAQIKKLNDAVNMKYFGRAETQDGDIEKLAPSELWEYTKEIGKNAISANADNPWAIAGDISESIPYMMGGPVGVALGAAAQTSEDSHHSYNRYQEREGHLPTATDTLKMSAVSAANFGLNFVENIIPVKALGLGEAAGKQASASVAKGAAETGKKINVKDALGKLKSAAGASMGLIGATAASGIAGGLQSGIQEGWGSLEKAPLRAVIEGAVQEGLAGGVTTAGAYGLGYAGEAGASAAEFGSQKLNKMREKKAAQNDFDTLINPESEYFNPAQAVNTQVTSYFDEKATDEQKAEAKAKMDQAIQVAEEIYTNREDSLNRMIESKQSILDGLDAELEAMNDALSNATTPEEQAEIKADIADAKKELDAFTKEIKDHEAELSKISSQRNAVYEARDRFNDQESALANDIDTPEAIQQTVTTLKSKPDADGNSSVTPEQMQSAVAKFKKNPMLVKPEDALEIVANPHVDLTDAERSSIRRLAEQQIALNKHKNNNTVSAEIVSGGKGFRGLNEYNREVSKALGTNRTQLADRYLRELDNFVSHYADKASVAEQALKESEKRLADWKKANPGKEVPQGVAQLQIYKDARNGAWHINRGEVTITDENREDYGALYVNAAAPKSRALMQQIREDANQVGEAQAALMELRNAYIPPKAKPGNQQPKTKAVAKPQAEQQSTPAGNTVNVYAGKNENTHLSNFAKRKFKANNKNFFSVEQAFHYAKAMAAGRQDIAEQVLKTYKGGELRKLTNAKNLPLSQEQRAKWDGMSENVLYKLMKASFEQNPQAAEALLDTGDATITHQVNGKEQDNGRFSKVLTRIREELRQDAQNAPESTETSEPKQSVTKDANEAQNALQSVSENGSKGKLAVFEGVSAKERAAENARPALERNWVKASFIQKSGKGFLNPLVEVKDFISNIRAVDNPANYLKDYYKKDIDEAQIKHFNQFVGFTDRFSKAFGKTFVDNRKYPEWMHTDYMQYLAQGEVGQPTFDENLVSAMAHSAFTWTAENGNTPWATDDSILENVFHFDNVDALSATQAIRREFRLSQSFTAMASEIGAKAVQALGLRLDTKLDIPESRKGKLESSIGGYIIHSMEHLGILRVKEVTDAEMAKLAKGLGEERYNQFLSAQLGLTLNGSRDLWDAQDLETVEAFERSTKVNQKFVDIVRTKDGDIPKAVADIIESAKGTRGFLNELFSVQGYNRAPSLEKPEGFDQTKIKNTTAGIPSAQKELLEKAQVHEQRIRTETLDPVAHIFENHTAAALHLFDLDTSDAWLEKNFHKREREAVKAKRQGVLRNLELALEFTRDYLKRDGNEFQPFYTEFEVWMPQRMGVSNNMMNTQSNTVHRALATPADFKMTVKAPVVGEGQNRAEVLYAASIKDGELTSLGNLIRAIAEGAEDMKVAGLPEGYLLKRVDKVKPDEFLPPFIAWMERADVQEAINAVSELRRLSAEKQPVPKEVFRAIKPVLDEMESGFMAFNSLVAMSELYEAINEGKGAEFTTYMRAGSDGVTSGSGISHLATATVDASTGNNDMAHGFGMITKEIHDSAGISDVFGLHAIGTKDIYQTLNTFQNKRWHQVFSGTSDLMSDGFTNDILNQLYASMNALYKDFSDRSKGKDSATPTIYGSGATAIKANVGEKALDKLYGMVRDLHHGKGKLSAEAITDHVNRMLQYYNNFLLPAKPQTYRDTKYKNENGQLVTALEYFGPKMELDYNMSNPDTPISFADMDPDTFLAAYARIRNPEKLRPNQIWGLAMKRYNSTRMGNTAVKYLPPDFLSGKKNLLETDFGEDVDYAVNKVGYEVHGKVHELGLKDAYKDYLQIRNVDVAMIDVGYTIYKEVKDSLIAKAMEKALDPDSDGPKVPYRVDKQGNKIPLEELPPSVMKEIEKQLFAIRPSLVSALSSQSQDPLGTGLMMAKQTERFMTDPEYRVQIQAQGPSKKMTSQLGTRSQADGNPGVLGAVIPVLSVDARIAAQTLAMGFATEDMHDSNYSNPDKAGEMGRFQNKALHDAIVTYPMQIEKLNVMMRGLEAWTSGKYILSEEANNRIIEKLEKLHARYYADTPWDARATVAEMIPELVKDRHYMEMRKISQFDNYYAIHHYGAAGGQYVLGEADAKLRNEEYNKIAQSIRKGGRAIQRALTVESGLNKIIDNGEQRVRKDVIAEQVEQTNQLNKTAQFLESKKDKTFRAGQLIGHLKKELKSDAGKQLLDVIEQLLPEGTTINYFNDQNVPDHVDVSDGKGGSMIEKGAAAWFDPTTNQINILDVKSKAGSVTAEMALHELLHAATSHAVTLAKEGKGTPQMQEAVKRLEDLRVEVLEKLSPEQRKQYENELTDVHELIAYGLSNKDFQKVLMNTPVRRGKRQLTTMFKDFVTNMLDLVFGVSQRSNHRKQIPAYEALVLDFANLAQSTKEYGTENVAKDVADAIREVHPMMKAQQNAQARIDAMPTAELFESLDRGTTSDAFNERARDLIETVVDAVMNREGRKPIIEAMAQQGSHANTARNAGFNLSDREAFLVEALEATIETALDNGAGTNIYKVFTSVHNEARKSLSPQSFFDGDWTTATAQDKALAQAKYDHLFKPTTTNGKNNMIARFAAMALGSEAFNKQLGFTVDGETKTEKSIVGKITDAVDTAIAWVMNWMAGIKRTDKLNTKVNDLVERMTAIDTKYRISSLRGIEKQYYRMVSSFGGMNTLTGAVVKKFAESEKASKSENRVIRTLGTAARVAMSDKPGEIADFFKKMRNHDFPNTRYGMIAETLREFEGAEGFTEVLHKLFRATKMIETERTGIKSGVMNSINKAFGSKLTDEQNKGLSYGLLKSGAHVLLDDFNIAEIRNLVAHADVRKKAIDDLTNKIKSHKDYRGRMIIRAKQLGWFTQTENPTPGLVFNALAIVQGVGSPSFNGELKAADPDLVKMIDQLATMYAFEYMTAANRRAVTGVMAQEIRRTGVEINGVEHLLGTHRDLVREANESLFAENPLSMIKGWVPDITNQYVKVQNFPMSQRAELEKKGWVFVASVRADAADFNQKEYGMFKWDNIGNNRRVSGAMSLTDTHSKGTVITDGSQGDFTGTVQANLRDLVRKNEFIDPDQYDPRRDHTTQLYANYDTEGNVMNYSYRMNAHTRDALLERKHDVGELLGEYAGNMYDKLHSPEQNLKVLQALHADFVANGAKDPKAYVAIGPKVADPGAQELWRLLPYKTRRAMEEVWGVGKPMYVRNDHVSLVFGHKKIVMGNLWNKTQAERNVIEKTYALMMEGLFKEKAQLRSYQLGAGWVELVKDAKDWIVLRTGNVLAGNIKFNAILLSAFGIAPTAIARDSAIAFRAGKAYREDMEELRDIEAKLRSGFGNRAELEHRYAQVQDSLARNPLREFIESGTMPTIVDDVEINQDDYSFKSAAGKRIKSYTDQIPEGLKAVGKTAIMSPGTVGHNFMSAATQYSDFMARYVVYNHMRNEEKMSHDKAVQEAMQMFIQYDLPSSPQMQWLNDVGLLMFAKFAIRFQHVMMKVLRKNPAFVMTQTLLLNLLTDLETVLDPNILNKGLGLFSSGPLALPSAIGGSTPANVVF